MGAEAILEEPRAADVVGVTVAHEDVLDLLRIQSERGQAIHDLVFDRVVEERVNDDDPSDVVTAQAEYSDWPR